MLTTAADGEPTSDRSPTPGAPPGRAPRLGTRAAANSRGRGPCSTVRRRGAEPRPLGWLRSAAAAVGAGSLAGGPLATRRLRGCVPGTPGQGQRTAVLRRFASQPAGLAGCVGVLCVWRKLTTETAGHCTVAVAVSPGVIRRLLRFHGENLHRHRPWEERAK